MPAIIKKENGQLTIFLAIATLILFGALAMLVNVGLFVVAKINLQNSVDAAAFSGAATQARQLSNISYLNWEMRNNYKEWLYKYYVLGQLSLPVTQGQLSPGQGIDFRLKSIFNPGELVSTNTFDRFNLPSVCLNMDSPGTSNICAIYDVPGFPRFKTLHVAAASEAHEKIMDELVKVKTRACSARGELNFQVAMSWTYGLQNIVFEETPQLLAHRMGVWPQGILLGMRMRNLEMIVNRPPVNKICDASSSIGGNCITTDALSAQASDLRRYNERPVKAFINAYRNLNEELQANFTLREIPPTPYAPRPLGKFLIPNTASYPGTNILPTRQKHYLDLEAYSINYAMFYTFFMPKTQGGSTSSDIPVQGACPSVKVAIPVPGLVMGMAKNPEVLTYYAVEGETKFAGLFYPFAADEGITLKAYSAAKPFGGRVGPRLFTIKDGGLIFPREAGGLNTSAPYISSLSFGTRAQKYTPGIPIPYDGQGAKKFWVSSSTEPVGGNPSEGNNSEVLFAVPNLLYGFESSVSEIANQARVQGGQQYLQEVKEQNTRPPNPNPPERLGLYDGLQFSLFRGDLIQNTRGQRLSAADMELGLLRARGPTKYEALNYLIPDHQTSGSRLESPMLMGGRPHPDYPNEVKSFSLFAPLISQSALYKGPEDIKTALSDYIESNKVAIQTYTDSLKEVADGIRSEEGPLYNDAANSIHPATANLTGDCLSLAGKFYNYFLGQSVGQGSSADCPVPLSISLEQYIGDKIRPNTAQAMFHRLDLYNQSDNSYQFTAYRPGPSTGATNDGQVTNIEGSSVRTSRRVAYSTKFVWLSKLVARSGIFNFADRLAVVKDGAPLQFSESADDLSGKISNLIPSSEVRELLQVEGKTSH